MERCTKQFRKRNAILTCLRSTQAHPSAETLHEMLQADYDAGGFISEGYEWTTTGHSSTDVWCYINGADIDFSKYALGRDDKIQNVDIFKIMKELMGA